MANEFRVKNGLITQGNVQAGSITSSFNNGYLFHKDGISSALYGTWSAGGRNKQLLTNQFNVISTGTNSFYCDDSLHVLIQGYDNTIGYDGNDNIANFIHINGTSNTIISGEKVNVYNVDIRGNNNTVSNQYSNFINIQGNNHLVCASHTHTEGISALNVIKGCHMLSNGRTSAGNVIPQVGTIVLRMDAEEIGDLSGPLINDFYEDGIINFNPPYMYTYPENLSFIAFFVNVTLVYYDGGKEQIVGFSKTFHYNGRERTISQSTQYGISDDNVTITDIGVLQLVEHNPSELMFRWIDTGRGATIRVIAKVQFVEGSVIAPG